MDRDARADRLGGLARIPARWIAATWLAMFVLAVGLVAAGEFVATKWGRPTGFYVGRLFIWVIWLAWLLNAAWLWSRERVTPGEHRWGLVLLGVLGGVWLFATLLEHL